MGSLAVLPMADHTGLSAPGGIRAVHPFFTAKRVAQSDVPQDPAQTNTALSLKETQGSSLDGANDDRSQDEGKPKKAGKRRKRAKADPELPVDSEKPRPKKRTKPAAGGNIVNHFGSVDGGNSTAADQDTKNTKNTKTESVASDKHDPEQRTAPPKPLSHTAPSALNTDNASIPKKIMKFNPKTGTIGSPPKPKASKIVPDPEAPGHTAPTDIDTKSSSKLVRIRYGGDDTSRKRIGERVNAILKGSPKTKSPRTPRKKNTQRPDPSPRIKKSPAKITHPFFAGKGKLRSLSNANVESLPSAPQPSQPKRNTIQSSTPCSPKMDRTGPSNKTTKPTLQFSVKSMGLKFPGSKLPAWPWKDMVHVRGARHDVAIDQSTLPHSIPSRRSKGREVRLSPHDSLMDMVTRRIDVPAQAEAVRNANSDDFLPPPLELRLPTKHFESGSKLQLRVLPELRCSSKLLANGNAKAFKKRSDARDTVADDHGVARHPRELVRLFNLIQSSLSAFDRADCDNTCWAQKYAPVCAAEVIQPGQEAFFLKEWLQALVVQSVDTGSGPGGDDKTGKDKDAKANVAAPKKRGRKRKQLDDFIVSSDEEANQMDEISDNEHDWTPSGKFGIVKKTVIRAGHLKAKELKDSSRLANAIVISGPHGCGKTAAVYAVAKELDFEVFEINSSSRRSGKDVDDKIGDMLKHHHVSHDKGSREKPATKEGDAEAQHAEEELAKDIASGKQKTMQSFFTKQVAPGKKVVKALPAVSKPPAPKEAKKDPPKGQKQSLILLDEVDILYDEDKQFWTRVIELMVKSKRPFVITCNDETLVPLHNLDLHGIFRLSAPPTDLAVDRLLLIAANEGHALRREPVEALYVARNHDLRAATMELNYWCQIGVGDRRGGFDWFYPRWPKGVDLDENKEVVRVVSEDTYQLGMGWLGRDMVVDKQTSVEEEILQQSWDLWNLDAAHWQDTTDFAAWTNGLNRDTAERSDRLATLDMYDAFAEAMSAADICSSKSFAQFKEELIDATITDLCSRSCDDYVLGLPVLDAPPVIRYDRMSTMLPNTMKSLARASLEHSSAVPLPQNPSQLPALNEDKATNMIRDHFSTPPVDTPAISRIDFSLAFDPIATSDKPVTSAVSYLDPSVLDRNMEPITLDVAPYVRSIVAYDQNLQQQRLRLSNLISEGGRKGPKRMRTTRAAYSALEGGSRKTTRADKWFKAELNPHLVMKTGGKGWTGLVGDDGSATLTSTPSPSKPTSSPGTLISTGSPSPVSAKAAPRKRGRPRKVVKDDSDDELA
ncbi:P-loop containing nucleoside triphosphate hydrolase protein [Coniochaeta ligniaria NRRL 30616]|uniref:p-loop containing nucleoside triphosphate hydrolase protein n=1 Tax=Coniochaeta ligniaria NRRL 30616 TaxID=1408157 RepID=A0A1J7IYV4_9PEZI|nr:P-loop containing nucleoside triphosphate hydrolase protein [Coniochaeta ligniaria NRRL 30616]